MPGQMEEDVKLFCIFPRWGEGSLCTLTLATCPLDSAQRKTGKKMSSSFQVLMQTFKEQEGFDV